MDMFGPDYNMGAMYGGLGPNGFYPKGEFAVDKRSGTAWATNGTADGVALAHNTMQPSLYLNHIIKI